MRGSIASLKALVPAFLTSCLMAAHGSSAAATAGNRQDENVGLTNWALGASYTVSQPPSDTYPDPQGQKLTDGYMLGPSATATRPGWDTCATISVSSP